MAVAFSQALLEDLAWKVEVYEAHARVLFAQHVAIAASSVPRMSRSHLVLIAPAAP